MSDAIDAATMTDGGGDRSVDGGVSDSSGEDTTAVAIALSRSLPLSLALASRGRRR
jgi:hypothetical protein